MGKDTKIEWTATYHADGTITPGHTWNPWQGCHKVSQGCAHCYMFREKQHYGQEPNVVVRSKPATFNAPLKWHELVRVFTCSWSDFFIEEADPWRDEAWNIIRKTPHLIYQILTKRPERIHGHLPPDWDRGWPNVMMGVTVENELTRWRIPEMMRSPASLYFVSVEPMLGPVDVREYLPIRLPNGELVFSYRMGYKTALAHVICGCESGLGGLGRPTDVAWIRDLRDQCVQSGTAFFLKQMDIGGKLVKVPPLDGVVWNQMPEVKR